MARNSRHMKFAEDSHTISVVIPKYLNHRIVRLGGNKSARIRKYIADGVERDERETARVSARQGN